MNCVMCNRPTEKLVSCTTSIGHNRDGSLSIEKLSVCPVCAATTTPDEYNNFEEA